MLPSHDARPAAAGRVSVRRRASPDQEIWRTQDGSGEIVLFSRDLLI